MPKNTYTPPHSTGRGMFNHNVRKQTLDEIITFLKKRGIKGEQVLDFICFENKGKHHRVSSVVEVKQILGIDF